MPNLAKEVLPFELRDIRIAANEVSAKIPFRYSRPGKVVSITVIGYHMADNGHG